MAKRKREESQLNVDIAEAEESEEELEDDESEAMEMDITVDEDGRICSQQGQLTNSIVLEPSVRVFDGILPCEHLEALKECSRTCFQAKPSKGRYSSGTTFWSDWNQSPRCELEALALAILRRHCPEPAADAGVEWWTLCLDENSEVGWHWDRDYTLESSGMNIHPMLATVTYLSEGKERPQLNTMTLDVLSSVQRTGNDVELPATGGTAWCTVVPPRLGRHLVFDGRFLHGAFDLTQSDLSNAGSPCERVTFLANVWVGHRPGNATPLPSAFHNFTGPESLRSVEKALISSASSVEVKVVEATDQLRSFKLDGGQLKVATPQSGGDDAVDVRRCLTPATWTSPQQGEKTTWRMTN